ncbi:MAG: SocA family protein [Prevotellaceae bacterium]|nr:SocA family protein [Prevotellaceae bacterium]
MSLGLTANKKRNGALLAYIAKNIQGINLRKLLKIVYLIDEKFMELRGFPLTWFDYYAWAKGPVAPEVYNVKNGAFSEYVTCHKNENGKNIIDSVLQHKYHVLKQMDIYSPYEMGIIDSIIYKYEECTADELSELTHVETSLWSQIVKEHNIQFVDGKSDILIPLQRMNEGDIDKEETYEEALEYMQFCNNMPIC